MADLEFELQRTIQAPIADVFARLADVEGHNTWMAQEGQHPAADRADLVRSGGVGTTYEDSTRYGDDAGRDRRVRPAAPSGAPLVGQDLVRRTKFEGWPGYTLEAVGEGETLVRHDAKLKTYGIYSIATPVLTMIAKKERTAVLDSLQKSFE